MGYSTSICLYTPTSPSSSAFVTHYFEFCSIRVFGRRKILPLVTTNSRFCARHVINSILGARDFSINSNEVPEPARHLLERLFVQTQKLEEQMDGNSRFDGNFQPGIDLVNLESDLQAVLEALRKKEEDLHEAERMVKLENAELNLTREQLQQREQKIEAACSKQEKLEEELRETNLKLVSQARHIEDLKFRLSQRNEEIAKVKFEVSLKENETEKMKRILTLKNDEASKVDAELESKSRLLNEVHEVVRKQELELQVLRNGLQEKQIQLEELLARQHLDEEKVKDAESKLEKRTMEWLVTQEELKKLGELASKRIGDRMETMEDFQRVKVLLVDVRSELVSSQQSLVDSKKRMEEREILLDKQVSDLNEQKAAIFSYMNGLKNARIEVESERAKLRVMEARNKELELDLSLKRSIIEGLQKELGKEKTSLEYAMLELYSIREELDKKNNEFEETSKLMEVKETELVEARLEIQHLKSERRSLQLVLQERDAELLTTRKRLGDVNAEVKELRILLDGKEEQLTLATDMLNEKEDYAQGMQRELNHAKLRVTEAASVVGRIVNLTKELAISSEEDDQSSLLGPTEDYRWRKRQLEAELELTRENLRTKEMELLAAQRQLTIKDEELKMIVQRLKENETKLKDLKESSVRADDLEKLSVSAHEDSGDSRVQELNTEKLQLEAAQLEVEAATSALQKLVEMSRQFLNKATSCIDTDLDVSVFPCNEVSSEYSMVKNVLPEANSKMVGNIEYITEVKSEVARLSALTERLVQEAGAIA
ncbi:hypothetical protein vseg_002530 [Gypsophila vaccaria]